MLIASPSTWNKFSKKISIYGFDYADSLVIYDVPDTVTAPSTSIFLHLILTKRQEIGTTTILYKWKQPQRGEGSCLIRSCG